MDEQKATPEVIHASLTSRAPCVFEEARDLGEKVVVFRFSFTRLFTKLVFFPQISKNLYYIYIYHFFEFPQFPNQIYWWFGTTGLGDAHPCTRP